MKDTLTRYINNGTLPERASTQLIAALTPVYDRYSTRGLTISTIVQSSATAAMGSADSYFVVQGTPVLIAANTVLTALTSAQVVADGTVNVFCWFVDAAGTVTVAMGTGATTLANMKFPPFPQGKALIGYAMVTCSGGPFTGGSSSLGTAGNFTVVFVSPVGPFDPTVLV